MARTGAHAFLYLQCRDLHDQLDSHPLLRSMASQELDIAGYGQSLAALQQCVVPAEAALSAFETATPLDFPSHYVPRGVWLGKDLQTLGLPHLLLSQQPLPESVQSLPAYLGYRYVLEGAALGSAWILQSMERRHPQSGWGSRQYLQAQAESALAWPRFTVELNAALADQKNQQLACMAARKLFGYFYARLEACRIKSQ